MKLPNAHVATVEQRKITDYLLNAEHPDNGGKARFFMRMGFTRQSWTALASALKDLAANASAVQVVESTHGRKYLADGAIATPSGKWPRVRSVWIIDQGEETPRLVTAYPSEWRHSDEGA